MSSQDYSKLIDQCFTVAPMAYSPYSNIQVGAALLCNDQQIFEGVNVENASYGLTICAERNAIGNAITHGFRKFIALSLYSPQIEFILPCGACRQVLAEFNPKIQILSMNSKHEIKLYSLDQIFKEAFILDQSID
ncbi:MAG: cytidine deaminase [Candidatus Delongbacteria bacterium]|nr:cytidine deaminase [Candidatus Delongbacteria bacterium]